MKINGKVIAIREVQKVELIRSNAQDSIVLKVSGYPIGIRRSYGAINPKPQPPKVATNVMRVGQKEPETKLDYENADYVKAIADWYYLEKFFVVRKCLEVDKDLEITNPCDTVESIRAFVQELSDAGFS